jgi:hypothetical protein
MSRRPIWLLVAALSLNTARADAPTDVGVAPAPKPVTKPAAPRAAAPVPEKKPVAKTTAKPTTRPSATKPAKEVSPEEMMSQMLKAPRHTGTKPLPPLPPATSGGSDKSSGAGAVAPAAPVVNVLREGTFLVDRVGRLSRSADGSQAEFLFETDGTTLQDPPLIIVPNLKLMQMEGAATSQGRREVRFRVSGMLTEYRGRNHILLDKVVVVPDVLEKY